MSKLIRLPDPCRMMCLKFQLILVLGILLCNHNVTATCADYFNYDYCHYTLHWAALSGDVKGSLTAINSGKNINEEIPGYGTPLHQAAFYGRAMVVKLLIQHGANLTITDADGDTPLKSTDLNWCSQKPNDRTCKMSTSDYKVTTAFLTAGCNNIGCMGQLGCHNSTCVNLCAGFHCGVNAVCAVQDDQPICQCNGDDYEGDPTVMCLELGEARYLYKAYAFVKDVVTTISSVIAKDLKPLLIRILFFA